jgi:hypothetical protein
MIDKWLKAGVLEDGLLRHATEGSPQGVVISPCLSNIFLHHVLDEWFENEVKPRLRGRSTLVRFADDAVMAFADFQDAKRVLDVLGKRLARYELTLHPDKTRLVDFRSNRSDATSHPGTNGASFTFLGFCHVWGKSRKCKNVVWQVTAKKRYARALAAVSDWCRENRHTPIREQHAHLTAMMRGHYAYFGITGNARRLRWYANQVERIWRKWLSRRDRRGRFPWNRLASPVKNRMLEIGTSGSVSDCLKRQALFHDPKAPSLLTKRMARHPVFAAARSPLFERGRPSCGSERMATRPPQPCPSRACHHVRLR